MAVAKRLRAVRRRVLILLGLDGGAGGVLDRLRRLEIRKALGEIDGVVQLGEPASSRRIPNRRNDETRRALRNLVIMGFYSVLRRC